MSNELLADETAPDSPAEPRSGNQRRTRGGCLKLGILIVLCLFFFIVLVYLVIDLKRDKFVALIRDIRKPEVVEVEKIVEKEKIVVEEKIVEVEKNEPMPSRFVARKTIDTTKLWNGLSVRSNLQTSEGGHATIERAADSGYEIELSVNLKIPRANQSLEELAALNPHLPKILPDLERMLKTGSVSPFFHYLYELKKRRLQQSMTRFDRILSRHNLFDCETILELTHPETNRRVLLMQGEMDVVSDGSDGDRWPKLDDYISMSDHYQYSTSFSWPKKSRTPNPLLEKREAELKTREARFAVSGLSVEENRTLRERIGLLKREIAEMKSRSFLIAEADPFIVIPLSMLGRRDETPFGPAIGDYAAVIYEGKIYPAICGDAGPSFQMGEASLRLAKQLNERAGVYSRPVSDLKVTYLVFPSSAEETRDAPDLERWQMRCQELLEGIGGVGEGYELHRWEDLIAKKRAPDEEKTSGSAPETEEPAVQRPAGTGN